MKCPKCGKHVMADFNIVNWLAVGADLAINIGIEWKSKRHRDPHSQLFSANRKSTYHCPNCGYVWKKSIKM